MTTRDELLKLADELDGAPNLELLELIGALRRRDAAAALRAYRAGAGPTREQEVDRVAIAIQEALESLPFAKGPDDGKRQYRAMASAAVMACSSTQYVRASMRPARSA